MNTTRFAHCHYCGGPGLVPIRGVQVCRRCIDLPRLEPRLRRDRPLLRPPIRGLAG